VADGITFHYRLQRGDFTLHAEAAIAAQGVTALFGRSGCGKTSLLRCIAGLERPRQAYLSVNGERWDDSSSGYALPPHKRAVGYVFQEGALFPHLNVKENLGYGYRRVTGRTGGDVFARVIKILDLQRLLQRYPSQLSGGEQQRVAIGRALLNAPRMLLMDEPMAALDRGHKKEIFPYLERLHGEARVPVIYVTHDLDELVRIADQLLFLEQGKVEAQGPLQEMLSRVDLLIARDADAGAVIDTTILEHDAEFHLTRLGFSGGELTVTNIDRPVGSPIRIRIHARDVSLALQPPPPSSILNILPCRIEELAEHGRGRVVVRLDVSGTPLLARITRKSQVRLGLHSGMQLYAQIKSVALSL
jgi:molybdate transport system ATP-binding protein